MFVAIQKLAIPRLFTRNSSVGRRLHKNEDGGAAVEFALLALPFFALTFSVIELGIFFFASRYLEDGVFNAGRKALTQNLSSTASCTDFRDKIRNNLGSWMDPAKLVISVKVLTSFTATSPVLDLANASCTMGATNQTLLVEVAYPYPFSAFRIMTATPGSGINPMLRAATALRVE
jgi:Flp pilus assembly protein TadG